MSEWIKYIASQSKRINNKTDIEWEQGKGEWVEGGGERERERERETMIKLGIQNIQQKLTSRVLLGSQLEFPAESWAAQCLLWWVFQVKNK